MALYCGIDLHSRDCWLAILDEELKVVQESKVGNDLDALLQVLEPYSLVPRITKFTTRFNPQGGTELGCCELCDTWHQSGSIWRIQHPTSNFRPLKFL